MVHHCAYVLKAPSENFADDVQYLEGFVREQWIGLRIDHPSIMKMYPSNHNSGFLYILLEYIEGQTLRQWMYDHPKVSLQQMRDIIAGIVKGMRVLQRMEMVHRDIKPENIMICDDGNIKLIDFGTVKVQGLNEINSLINEEVPVGSVNYIAPEYLLEGYCDFRSDIFSVGMIAYEILSGKLPYNMGHTHRRKPKSLSEWHYQSMGKSTQEIPEWIDCALQKAVHPNIQRRYDSLSEFVADLSQPNTQLIEHRHKAPLLERHPVVVWQGVSCVLLAVVIVQLIINHHS
jgi:protein phosphatase